MNNLNRHKIISDNYFDLIVEYNENLDLLTRFGPGSSYNILDDKYAIVYIPIDFNIEDSFYKFGYNQIPTCNGLMSGISSDFSTLSAKDIQAMGVHAGETEDADMQAGGNHNLYNLYGKGVLIGIIDTGVDYTNSSLLNQDGSSRIVSIWDQSIDSNNYPANYYYGTEYKKADINCALEQSNPLDFVSSRDTIGHGTSLATIAGGSFRNEKGFSGLASRSDFVIVKLKEAKNAMRQLLRIPNDAACYQSNDIMFAIRYLVETAKTLQRPIAICIGVSTSQGSNQGLSSLDDYMSKEARVNGQIFLVPAGNEGNSGHHYNGNIDKDDDYDDFTLNIEGGEEGFSFEFWGHNHHLYTIDIYTPDDAFIGSIPILNLDHRHTQRFTYKDCILYADNIMTETHSGAQLTIFRFSNPIGGQWKFRVSCDSDISADYNVWLPIESFLSSKTYVEDNTYYSTLTGAANSSVPIAITAYNSRNQRLYRRASKGFPYTSSRKPDVAAPGVNITASTIDNQLISVSGTGAATAHTTGAVALFLEWGIVRGNLTSLNTVDVRNILNITASREQDISYPNPYWGYGKLNIYSALQYASSHAIAGQIVF